MATIITVHGTFSTGPESGEQWWQKGSQFESGLRRLVEGEDGTLVFLPHVWDGLNSETSRRVAGKSLFGRLSALEKEGQRYCLIGHSHGGSVIVSSLFQSAYRRRSLSGLSRWITIGTPFIGFEPKIFLFSRVGVISKAVYLTAMTLGILMIYSLWVAIFGESDVSLDHWLEAIANTIVPLVLCLLVHSLMSWNVDRHLASCGSFLISNRATRPSVWFGLLSRLFYLALPTVATFWIIFDTGNTPEHVLSHLIPEVFILVAAVLIAFLGFGRLRGWLMRLVSRGDRARSIQLFSSWLSLRHSADEAIEGLRRLPRISIPIFARSLAVAPLTFVSAMAVPMLLVAAIASPGFMTWIAYSVGMAEADEIPAKNIVLENLKIFFQMPAALILGYPLYSPSGAIVQLILAPALYLICAVVFIAIVRYLASIASRLLSALFDRIAWDQIRASAYGSDTIAEDAKLAADAPPSIGPQPPLPQDLAEEISMVADVAAVASISKLRGSLNRLVFAEENQKRADLVSQYLTGNELIHTAYFKVPLFNKLVAYAISRSEGFRPTAAFLADPDYNRATVWYAELTGGKDTPVQTGLDVKGMEPAVST
jgi:hypothetical protein